MKYNNVYTVHEENSHKFYQIPKELFTNEKYKGLDLNAKVLYSLLLDRKELSRKNNWVDEYDQVYLLYSRENVAEMLCISKPTVIKAFKQLSKARLIIEERQGLTKPNKIYICKIEHSGIIGSKESLPQRVKIVDSNDTDFNDTEKIKRYTITSNGDRILNYYNLIYEKHFNKEHSTVTKEQLDHIEDRIEEMTVELDITDDAWMEVIDHYFENLPTTNNGNILSFVSGNKRTGPVIRYLHDYVY